MAKKKKKRNKVKYLPNNDHGENHVNKVLEAGQMVEG